MVINPTKTHKSSIKRFSTLEEDYNKIHNNKYDYSRAVYNGDSEKITIICPVHGEFEQRAGEHLRYGCRQCSVEFRSKQLALCKDEVIDRYKNKPTILYIVKINNLYKVGITQSGINARFNKELKEGIVIEILYEKVFDDGLEAYSREQEILLCTAEFSVDMVDSPLINGGYTELRYINLYEYLQKFDWFEI